ncbi:hypothetical protein ACM706_18505 [Pseudomonas aeruginosa]
MNDLLAVLQFQNLCLIKDAISRTIDAQEEVSPEQLSNYLFRREVGDRDKAVISAHLTTIEGQLEKILNLENKYYKQQGLFLEYSKGITRFNELTNSIPVEGGTLADNMIIGQHFYQSARSTYIKAPVLYQGNLDISMIPIKLRLAIEVYFKNLIGFSSAKSTYLSGKRKGKEFNFSLKISDLLSFFSHAEYKKYADLPVSISILKDINVWSNNLIHTGLISYPWQSIAAVELLKPLFKTELDDGRWNIEGFNYLNLNYAQEALAEDLGKYLSNQKAGVVVNLFKRGGRPVEGSYYKS